MRFVGYAGLWEVVLDAYTEASGVEVCSDMVKEGCRRHRLGDWRLLLNDLLLGALLLFGGGRVDRMLMTVEKRESERPRR